MVTLSVAGWLLLAPAAWGAGGHDGNAQVTGVVRDSDGVAQMGALVQLLGANASVVGSAFTDSHGHYTIAHVLPGLYRVRATSTLLVPSTRPNVKLAIGGRSIVNLTLTALFDTASWLPANRRRADEPEDEWKWTLRSQANRPLLRAVDEDGDDSGGTGAPDESMRTETLTTLAGNGFGEGGIEEVIALRSESSHGRTTQIHAGTSMEQGSFAPRLNVSASTERESAFGGGNRTEVSFRSEPGLQIGSDRGTGDSGIRLLTLRSAQTAALGDRIELEVGSALSAVESGRSAAWAAHPFVRLTAHPGEGWRVQYRIATSRTTQEFADLNTAGRELPAFSESAGGDLQLESGRHQEFAVARTHGRTTFEVAYFRDALENVELNGTGAGTDLSGLGSRAVTDSATGSFRALATGYRANGARVTLTAPVSDDVWFAAEYSTGDALASTGNVQVNFARAVELLQPKRTDAASIAVKASLSATGTRLRASYRWQPANRVTAVNPYGAFSDQAYLSMYVRQNLPRRAHLPQGLSGTIDITNLLAQGYRPFVSADGRTLYLAQSPRTLQAGLSLAF